MTEDDKKSLVVAEDGEEGEETLAQELGGYQALVLFVLLGVVGVIVFAFPTPFNPFITDSTDDDLIVTLGELDAGEETAEMEPSATPDEIFEISEDIEDTEGESEVFEAEDQLETEEATTAPTATAVATEPPTATAIPTEPPTATVLPTEPPTATAMPTEPPTATTVPTEMPSEDEDAAAGPTIAEVVAAGDIDAGQAVFNAPYETSAGTWLCSSCHSIDEAQTRMVGPGLWGLYDRADERAESAGDPDAVTYVYNSIIAPAAYHVEDELAYPENLMPPNYAEVLTEAELDNVVAYVLSLGNPDA